MSLSTMATDRKKEMKLSMAVVATRTLATGRAVSGVFVRRGSGVMWPQERRQLCSVLQSGVLNSDQTWLDSKTGLGADPGSHQTTEASSLTFSNCPHSSSNSTQKSLRCPKPSKRLCSSFQFLVR